MPQKLLWTDFADASLCRLRAAGDTWDGVAAALGVSRNAAIERARLLGAHCPGPRPDHPRRNHLLAAADAAEERNRPPLPPGHPTSWGAITENTLLDGTDYPLPVFV